MREEYRLDRNDDSRFQRILQSFQLKCFCNLAIIYYEICYWTKYTNSYNCYSNAKARKR
jgi:hypothetical protein